MAELRATAGAHLYRSCNVMGLPPGPMGGDAHMIASDADLLVVSPQSSGLRAESPLDSTIISTIRRRASLEGCKWDPQVGDVTTLAAFPLVMKRRVWEQLTQWAEQLTAE